MKALALVRHGSSRSAFAMENRPDLVPGPGQVRIAVEASGVNFADILARQGAYPAAPPPPCVLGFEVVGRIDAIGPDGSAEEILAPGQRVVAFTRFGGYASQALASVQGIVAIPEELDPRVAAALATQGVTAWLAADWLVRIMPGDLVLVQAAAGGVGAMLVQRARAGGAVVAGTAGSEAKLAVLRRLGVDYAIDYRTHDFAQELLRVAGGRRPDVIFDSIGGSTARKGWSLLANGGRMVCYGAANLAGSGWALPRAAGLFLGFGFFHPFSLMTNSKGLLGLNLLRIADERPALLTRALNEVARLAASGTLEPVVDRSFPAEAVAEAHERVESRESTGKVILEWSSAPAGLG